MKRHAVFMVVSVLFAVFAAACGSDKIAPGDPASDSVIPDTVFFNLTGNDEVILFSGRATDNRWVDTVQISFDNGATWHTADIDPDPSVRDVKWSYYAVDGDMPSPSTVLISVADQDGNATTSSPFTVSKASGSAPANLLAVFSGAADGDVIALSSGAGDAYGSGGTTLNIPVNVNLTVFGAGYGDADTSGSIPLPAVASTATILEASPSGGTIFSVGADLIVRDIRLVGAVSAINVDGVDASIVVEDCLFDGQDAWAVRAVGNGSAVDVQFLSSGVDASSASSSGRGGLYLDGVSYEVTGSAFYYLTDPLGPGDDTVTGAAVQAVGGSGFINKSIFEENTLAIWASGGSPIINSCQIAGMQTNTNGIDISGTSGVPRLRYNDIGDNSGFGVRVRGSMTPKFFKNIINIDTGTYPDAVGIYVQDLDALPDLGMFPYDESGCNKLESDPAIIVDYVIEVDDSTDSTNVIYAGSNFWGTLFNSGTLVHTYKIYDGHDGGNDGALVDLTGTPGGVVAIIWSGTGGCP